MPAASRLSQRRRVPGTELKRPLLPHNRTLNATFVAARKRPSGDVNGTTHFGAEAGAVSGPARLHPSVCSAHRHFPCSLSPSYPASTHQSLLSIHLLSGSPHPTTSPLHTPIKPVHQAHPCDLSEADFMGFSPLTDGYLAVLTQPSTICYCKCLLNTFKLFALMALW